MIINIYLDFNCLGHYFSFLMKEPKEASKFGVTTETIKIQLNIKAYP